MPDDTQKAMERWPAADRAAWQRAVAPGDLLTPGGPASSWAPATRRHVIESYGCWLAWLGQQGLLDLLSLPEVRCTTERLVRYTEEMRARLAPATVRTRLVGLERALAALAPHYDRRLLRQIIRRLPGRAIATTKGRERLRHSRQLYELGLSLMHRADTGAFAKITDRAACYRDGLVIALLAARPLRRRNISNLTIGRHLVLRDGAWWITIPAEETKTRRAIEVPFPEALAPYLERYLDNYRPMFKLQGRRLPRSEGPLWLSAKQTALASHTVAVMVARRTAEAFGTSTNLHLFRDCAATSMAIEDPAHVRVAAAVLGHSSFTTTEKHYNLARSLEAAADYQQKLKLLARSGG